MYYRYDPENGIPVPAPYARVMTPVFMGDDDKITDCPFSVHITEWEPGCAIDAHAHPNGFEAMYLMSGHGKVVIGGEAHEFVPDSMIVAAPGVMHEIMNTGTELLRVLCIFTPPVTGASLRERAMQAVNDCGNIK